MSSDETFWYRVGYTLESAKAPTAEKKLERPMRKASKKRPGEPMAPHAPSLFGDDFVVSSLAAVAARLLDTWQPKRKAGFKRLLWAGAAGAAAALLLDVLKPVLRGQPELPALDRDMADRLLAGVGQGLVYGAIFEPRIPGPAVLKGALFGSAEYAAEAAGGLAALLGDHVPHSRLPIVGGILESADPHDRVYLEHLAFGVALALIYGSSASSSGILAEEDEGTSE